MKVYCISLLFASLGVSSVAGFSIAGTSSINSPAASASAKIQKTTSSSLSMATWSDAKAVREYQEFLNSGEQEIKLKSDGPSAIIYGAEGANELAESLWAMGMGDDVVLTPSQDLPSELGGKTEYPIYITLPPTQLQAFLSNLSDSYKERWADFVFFSGGLYYGNIEDLLKDNGLCRDSMTQAIMTGYERMPSGTFRDLSTRLGADAVGEEKWAGECAACGKWNGAIAERLERNAIRCSTDFYRDWRRKMWERTILDCVFNLVGVVRQEPTSLANVAQYYENEVSDMVWQISQQLRGWKAMTLMYGFEERLFGVAENTGAEKPCMLVDELYPFIWGNPVFTEAPMILDYLWYAKTEVGLLQNVDLPPKKGENDVKSNIMREGNFRADGVI
mmetsp:Transcript_58464/g.163814  ORF Transcript_58464/g.163814 Transcript_58464/m.163814 type:complete len:390 (+) Transcript_58464:125-1294(+)